ncbi:protein phosphatase 1 regulatory subunit 12A isoform X5 [Microplitis mediator]|uniref:protein phosphatase 1 regulatory subunit 12A isoform X5 n=1 Tax=Microplitis mediator TaxID=375433 RepID=UPI002555A434|nr:protein phosphatase 1 regulatory subunit 12A isoform X5 [Microplitis mediator]
MSLETRSNSALFKRAEQLKRWEQSETNREPAQPRQIARKIKFSADCVFLAACAAGDKEEVVRLLQKGADINTGNVDGLTALHQACIDDDLDMVEFLVEQGADINRGDNEGWTPLHATASCGFISIAKYLIEQGCNLAAVNNDGELALDIAESDEMEDLLQQHINKAGIDCDQARSEEERSMLSDAKAWKAGSPGKDAVHPRTGATALHVAAAKGYIKVMNILLQARCDVNAQDYDGWTPLHGAAHWGQLEACKLLVENYCDMDIKNFAGQTAFDVADTDILKALEELKKKQQIILKDHPLLNNQKQLPIPKKRMSPTIENTVVNEGLETFEEETPNKVIKVELEIQSDKDDTSADTNSDVESGEETDIEDSDDENDSESSSDSETSSTSNYSNQSDKFLGVTDDEKKNRANKDDSGTLSPVTVPEINKLPNQAPILPPKQQTENTEEGTIPSWRRSGSFRSRIQENEPTNSVASTKENEDKEKSIKTPLISNKINQNTDSEVVLRRTHSFETDEKRKEVKLNLELSRVPQESNSSSPTSLTNKFLSSPVLPTSTTGSTPTSSTSTATTTTTSPVPGNQIRSVQVVEASSANVTPSHNSTTTTSAPTTPAAGKLSPGNIFKNFFKSFVPPVRDEESETQRKAHAKRVRETRRSTQGVTLDEIKSAEQLVKKKQQQTNDTPSSTPQPAASLGQTASIIATITTATPTTVTTNKLPEETNLPERRPSWRLRVDNGSKFQLEDANNKSSDTTTAYIRRPSGGTGIPRPSSAPVDSIATSTADATVTLPLRRSLKSPEDKDQDKENDSRNAQATQAVIQRRRRPKRRSTGVVHVDMDEIDPDKQDTSAGGDYEESKTNHTESGNERSGRSSRLGSVTSLSSDISVTPSSRIKSSNSENGELDYKKLWEESQAENERLKEKLRRSDEQLKEVRGSLEKVQSTQSKLTLSEAEKRERRAMERKLSEMEEELKQLQKLKAENERLKAENRALTRVVSKLTNTTK